MQPWNLCMYVLLCVYYPNCNWKTSNAAVFMSIPRLNTCLCTLNMSMYAKHVCVRYFIFRKWPQPLSAISPVCVNLCYPCYASILHDVCGLFGEYGRPIYRTFSEDSSAQCSALHFVNGTYTHAFCAFLCIRGAHMHVSRRGLVKCAIVLGACHTWNELATSSSDSFIYVVELSFWKECYVYFVNYIACYLEVPVSVGHVAPHRAFLLPERTQRLLFSRVDVWVNNKMHYLTKLASCRTLDPLLSKSYFYWARCVELKGKSALAGIRNELLSAYRTAVLKHDQIGQVKLWWLSCLALS